eukprot:GDKH01001056.1.p1 GENE.GDKH01001056.1~~GDKH01001056.1.p1  ORF type:complete len:209 (-),score=17.33 GDKH01001056.1:148-774(-)
MSSQDDQVSRLYRVRRTLYKMLSDRGYNVSDADLHMTKDNFVQLFESLERNRERLVSLHTRKVDETSKIVVYFAESSKKVGVGPIKKLTERMEEWAIDRAILICQHPLTPFAAEAVKRLVPKLVIEVFNELELLVNITEHELVPRHKPLTEEEKRTVLQRYNVKDGQLPRIQTSDPVARYFGLSRGQVVKIVRPSETAGRYVTYRIVL